MIKKYNKIALIILGIFVFTGCSNVSKIPVEPIPGSNTSVIKTSSTLKEELARQSDIKKFTSIEELNEFLENNETITNSSYARGLVMDSVANDMMFESSEVMPKTKSLGLAEADGSGSSDFSTTNIQVEGVDEADIIKTDGKYIYALVKNELFFINAFPAKSAEIISKIKFKDRPQNIYINGDRLVVYGRDNSFYNKDLYKKFVRRNSFTFLKIFDISDKENPKQVRDLNFEGNYTNSRMIGDYVYFVTTNNNHRYYSAEPVLPRIIDGEEVVLNDCNIPDAVSLKCFTPDIYYFDMPYSSYNMTSVTAINVKDEKKEIKGDVYLMNSGQNMYVSLNNIYITYTKYVSENQLMMEVVSELVFPNMTKKGQEKIAKIENVENFILSKNEKQNKINAIVQNFLLNKTEVEKKQYEKDLELAMKAKYKDISKELEKTVIHKIAINKDDLEYKNHGEVTGHVLNQFSMDESAGYFRIATTKNRTWSRFNEENQKSYNNLYVLDDDLKVVGALENLAEDERIKSVRFMQNRAYMVTFKQIDPLFVIDLKNPKKPTVLGELKIPGYSDYLHPYDENTLIGLGKDAFENEFERTVTGGVKLSMFDVSDVENPKEIDSYIMGDSGSNSIALHDHKAFYFEHDKGLLAIPISIREKTGEKYYNTNLKFSGAMIFTIDKNGFKLKGEIDHSEGGQKSNSDYWGGYSYYDNSVKRVLHIDDMLYTFSNLKLKMNSIDDLDEVNNVRFIEEQKDFEVINRNSSEIKVEPMKIMQGRLLE